MFDLCSWMNCYRQAHPNLSKSERKRLCRILDCKKLSMEACMHAAQNEHLPLRVVVQVLFYEHTRASIAINKVANLPADTKAMKASARHPNASLTSTVRVPVEDQWSVSGLKSTSKSKISTLKMKLAEDEADGSDGLVKGSKLKGFCLIPNRPKRMFTKLMSMNRAVSENH